MSIINQMLLKLEKRHGGRVASLPDGVRAVATASQAARRPLALGVVLAVLAAMGGYYGWTWWQHKTKPAKSVAVSGKIPGMAPRQNPKAPAPPPKVEKIEEVPPLPEEVVQKLVVQKLQEEPEKPEKRKNSAAHAPKKKAAPSEMTEAGAVAAVSDASQSLAKKYSRESAGKLKPVSPDAEAGQGTTMKSVSSQQQALFYYQKAQSWLQQGRVSEARSGLEEALKLDPRHLAARQALAALMVEQRQYHQAELILQEGLNSDAEQYGFAMALARLQVERGDTQAALDTLYKSLPHAAANAGFQAFLAALLQRAEQHKKAIEHYQAALRLMNSGAWQVGLGISLHAENRSAEALEAFGRAKASGDLTPDLSVFVEQQLRIIKKTLQPPLTGEARG
ncbi:MAG: tetratricopeptide repeat protein [Sulfuricellaceae bacterium]